MIIKNLLSNQQPMMHEKKNTIFTLKNDFFF